MAAFVGQPVWAALVGAGLGLVYWALDALTWWRARDRQDLAIGVALSGVAARIFIVLAVLIIIALLDRPSLLTATLSFVAAFTVYNVVRPFTYPTASTPAGQARLQ